MIAILVPILLGLGFFAMIFGIAYLENEEKMAMIQKGMNPNESKPLPQPYRNLKWGLLLMGAGLGLFLAYVLDNTIFDFGENRGFGGNDNPAVYLAFTVFFGGLGLFISYLMEKKALDGEKKV